MALSSLEKAKIKKYLGMSLIWGQNFFHLNQALQGIDADADATSLVQGVLTKLAAVEIALDDQLDVLIAKKAEGIELSLNEGLDAIFRLGWQRVIDLGSMLGVQPRLNIFGEDAPTYIFADPSGLLPGGISPGNILPRG